MLLHKTLFCPINDSKRTNQLSLAYDLEVEVTLCCNLCRAGRRPSRSSTTNSEPDSWLWLEKKQQKCSGQALSCWSDIQEEVRWLSGITTDFPERTVGDEKSLQQICFTPINLIQRSALGLSKGLKVLI